MEEVEGTGDMLVRDSQLVERCDDLTDTGAVSLPARMVRATHDTTSCGAYWNDEKSWIIAHSW